MLKSLDGRIFSTLLIKRGLNLLCPWCASLVAPFLRFQSRHNTNVLGSHISLLIQTKEESV